MLTLHVFIRLSKCPYIGCMKGFPDLMLLRHLLWRSVPIEYAQCSIAIKDRTDTKVVKQMLEIAKLFPSMLPDGTPSSEAHAVTWLLSNPVLLDTLSQAAGFCKPCDIEGIHAYCAFPSFKIVRCSKCTLTASSQVICCHQRETLVLVLRNRQLAGRMQWLGAAAEHATFTD
jgi:hypothetical protein